MRHDDGVYLGHMVEMAREPVRLVTGLSRDQYHADLKLRLALLHLIQIVGEAARQVSQATKEAHPENPWKRIIGMRHRIVHDYPDVDEDIVWDTSTQSLSALIEQLTPLLPPHLREPPKG